MNLDFQLIIDSIAEGVVVTNAQGKMLFVNRRMMELFGYQENEILGQNVELLIPTAFRKNHVTHLNNYFKQPKARPMGKDFDLKAVKKNGVEFPIEISLNFFDNDGKKMAFGLISDITERKKAEHSIISLNNDLERKVKVRTAELQSSILLYNAIAENFPDGMIIVLDENFNYIFCKGNDRKGIDPKEIGNPFLSDVPMEYRNEVLNGLDCIFDGNRVKLNLKRKNQFYEIDGVPLYGNGADVERILLIEKNVTPFKLAEEKLAISLEKERNLNTLKSRFVSMASHEFRTPLSSILSSVELIEKYRVNSDLDKQEKHIRRIQKSVSDLINILNDFLSLDKLEEGLVKTNFVELNLKNHIESLIDETRVILKTGQHVHYAHKGDETWFLDVNIFKNIFLNLLSNASKYSAEGDEIKINTAISKDRFSIEIKDVGIGIPEEEQDHLFDRFFRAHNAANISGTGLGLNIVRKYVQLLNGTIHCESKLNQGSIFSLEFGKGV